MTVVLMVLDAIGIGPEPDAADYGDDNCSTLGHIAEYVGGLNLPNLEQIGMGRICPVRSRGVDHATGRVGVAHHLSPGKGTKGLSPD